MTAAVRYAVRVRGTVQGVGYRPFVHGLANELGLVGTVGNDADGVVVHAQGPAPVLAVLARRLSADAPALALVESVEVAEEPARVPPEPGFTIAASAASAAGSTGAGEPGGAAPGASIPPDVAVCAACLAEMRDPSDRRFGYAFIACAHCGPRYTMTVGLPYDRANTTMAAFPLCGPCRAEYEDPASRRFHAQPTACPECGPRLSRPVADVAADLRAGLVVAIKGVGGYHLACDARNPAAVGRLRARKHRGDKPFAVMVADLGVARRIAGVDETAAAALTDRARPIVILPARERPGAGPSGGLAARERLRTGPSGGLAEFGTELAELGTELAGLADLVAPRTGTVGVLLPYAPLHHLLFDAGAPEVLVMTSGNLADEPICTDPAEAEERLGGLADTFCHHDRAIHVACDDSVLRSVGATQPDGGGGLQPVRRSRGSAPTPLRLPFATPPTLAVGGELKTTIGVAAGRRAWLSQHIGDTENLATLAMLERTAATLGALQGVVPAMVVSDAHPDYLSTRWAADHAARLGVPHVRVQHHHAHLAALLAEHGVPPGEPVLGLVLDGSGYGADGTIWGGELLLGSYAAVRRVGHLAPIALPGGDAATRHPARSALAHLHAAGLGPRFDASASAAALSGDERRVLTRMLATGTRCATTTSAGRLFDAVSSLLGVCHRAAYEAQAAIELEAQAAIELQAQAAIELEARAAAELQAQAAIELEAQAAAEFAAQATARGGAAAAGWPPMAVRDEGELTVIDPAPWLAWCVRPPVAQPVAPTRVPALAAAFHAAFAGALARAAARVCGRHGVRTVGLTGGVFANDLLATATARDLAAAGLTVLTHAAVPANDGGLALGQIAVAAARAESEVGASAARGEDGSGAMP